MDVPVYAWIAVVAAICAFLAVDLFVLHRDAHEVSVREAALTSAAWVTLGLSFTAVVWWVWGGNRAGEYVAGYLIEKSLSVDNIFVIALLLAYFAVPPKYHHRVLFWGVVGALVLRAAFIFAGAAFLDAAHWAIYVFGALLVVSGLKMVRHGDDEVHPERNPVLRVTRRVIPMTDRHHDAKFFVKQAGKWVATPLFAVLLAVETTDVVFAADSIPAIFAVTDEPFLVFTSNAFAICGLRALYFLLAGVMDRFVYLKTGLAAILVFVGAKMLLADVYHVPIWASLLVIAAILTVAVVASLRSTAPAPPGATGDQEVAHL
jgi:tellurite resistance protein TerC